jgi:enoyl-CoA hydratase/carnithine racemase
MIEGTRITGDRALELGLVNKVVADDDLQDAALDWAKTLAGKSPLSLSCTKEALNAAMECDFGTAISVEADLQMVCVASEDAREGAMAFFERRAPVWKGR